MCLFPSHTRFRFASPGHVAFAGPKGLKCAIDIAQTVTCRPRSRCVSGSSCSHQCSLIPMHPNSGAVPRRYASPLMKVPQERNSVSMAFTIRLPFGLAG